MRRQKSCFFLSHVPTFKIASTDDTPFFKIFIMQNLGLRPKKWVISKIASTDDTVCFKKCPKMEAFMGFGANLGVCAVFKQMGNEQIWFRQKKARPTFYLLPDLNKGFYVQKSPKRKIRFFWYFSFSDNFHQKTKTSARMIKPRTNRQ